MADVPAQAALPPYTGNTTAPFVYFDFVPTFGVFEGAIQLELAARTMLPGVGSDVPTEVVCTGHVRCSPAAAMQMKEAIEKALAMLQQPMQGPNRSSMN